MSKDNEIKTHIRKDGATMGVGDIDRDPNRKDQPSIAFGVTEDMGFDNEGILYTVEIGIFSPSTNLFALMPVQSTAPIYLPHAKRIEYALDVAHKIIGRDLRDLATDWELLSHGNTREMYNRRAERLNWGDERTGFMIAAEDETSARDIMASLAENIGISDLDPDTLEELAKTALESTLESSTILSVSQTQMDEWDKGNREPLCEVLVNGIRSLAGDADVGCSDPNCDGCGGMDETTITFTESDIEDFAEYTRAQCADMSASFEDVVENVRAFVASRAQTKAGKSPAHRH